MYKITETELKKWNRAIKKYLKTIESIPNIRKDRSLLLTIQYEINTYINPEKL